MFVVDSEQSKAYRIYIPGYRQIELNKDVTFDAFRKSRKNQEDEEEHEAPRVAEISKPIINDEEEQMPEDHDMTEPQRLEEFSSEMISCKRRPAF